VSTDVGIIQPVGVNALILMPWHHCMPKIESLGVLDARQI